MPLCSMLLNSARAIRNKVGLSSSVSRRAFSAEVLEKTAYYDAHVELGGKMVPFAGYELPVQYAGEGVMKEHLHVRAPNSAGIFDVGHMGQIKWHGKDAAKFLEMMVCGDIHALKPSEGKLSLIMNESGGIMDDCVISNTTEDYIYMVVNGACKHKDMAHFQQYVCIYTYICICIYMRACVSHSS